MILLDPLEERKNPGIDGCCGVMIEVNRFFQGLAFLLEKIRLAVDYRLSSSILWMGANAASARAESTVISGVRSRMQR